MMQEADFRILSRGLSDKIIVITRMAQVSAEWEEPVRATQQGRQNMRKRGTQLLQEMRHKRRKKKSLSKSNSKRLQRRQGCESHCNQPSRHSHGRHHSHYTQSHWKYIYIYICVCIYVCSHYTGELHACREPRLQMDDSKSLK